MNIGVIAQPNSWYVADLHRAATARGDQISVAGFSELVGRVGMPLVSFGEHKLAEIDLILVRSMPPGSLEQVVFRMNALQELRSQTAIPVVNPPRAMEIAIDKYLCLCKLAQSGLPVPKSLVSQNAEQAMEHFFSLSENVVVKPIFGGEGRGMMRLEQRDLAWRTFKTLERSLSVIYQQQFLHATDGDLRVFLLGGQPYAMRRVNASDWRSNVSRGGETKSAQPTAEQIDLALKASAASGCEIAGVDILTDGVSGRDYVLEVNAVPGWKALSECLEIDIADRLLDWCANKIQRNA